MNLFLEPELYLFYYSVSFSVYNISQPVNQALRNSTTIFLKYWYMENYKQKIHVESCNLPSFFLHILGIGAMAEVTSIVAIVKDHLETMK